MTRRSKRRRDWISTPPAGRTAAPSAGRPSRARRALPLVFLFAIACVAYLNAGHDEFFFDSSQGHFLVRVAQQGLAGTAKLFWDKLLYPGSRLTDLTYAIQYTLNKAIGLDPFGVTTYLVFNVFVHAINACLVFLLVRALLNQTGPDSPRATWIPLAAATLFAVHPLHASSVVYIVQRRGALATTFYLLAVLAYLRVRPSRPHPTRSHAPGASPDGWRSRWPWSRLVLAATVPALYVLSYNAKTLGLTMPAAILAVEFCLRASDRSALRRYLMVLIPGVVAFTAGMFLLLWMWKLFDPSTFHIRAWGTGATWGVWPHFLTECRAFAQYWKLIWLPLPRWSCVDHGLALSEHPLEHGAVLAVAFHALVLAMGLFAAFRRHALVGIGLFWFYIALIPYVLLPQVELFVEYKTYLPSIGAALIVAGVLQHFRDRVPLAVPAVVVGAAAVLLLGTTLSRNRIYHSAEALWGDAVEKCPDHYRPHNNLANALIKQGRVEEALGHYRETIRLAPDWHVGYRNLGLALAGQGKFAEAVPLYEKALTLEENDVESHRNLADALAQLGELDQAITHYRRAIELRPGHAGAHHNLANVLLKTGDLTGAIEHYRQAVASNPDHPNMLMDLANALFQQGESEEAITYLKRLIELDPDYAAPHFNLATVLAKEGQFEQAIHHYQETLRWEPNHVKAHNRLGFCLEQLGQIDQAIQHYARAVELKPDYVEARYNLGAALAARGRLDQAIHHLREALRLDPAYQPARAALATLPAGKAGSPQTTTGPASQPGGG